MGKEDEARIVRICFEQVRLLGPESYPRFAAVDAQWWRQWQRWSSSPSSSEGDRPGPLKNDGVETEWVPEEVWRALTCWYAFDGEPVVRALKDSAVGAGGAKRKKRSLSIYEDFELPSSPPYWDVDWQQLSSGGCTTCLAQGPTKVCSRCNQAKYCSQECQAAHWRFHKAVCSAKRVPPAPRRGLVGLANLGNTCYMNSTVQCLSHCWPLTRYFVSGKFRQDCNEESTLGTGGRFAKTWDALMREMWLGDRQSISPSRLKRAIATLPGSGNQFAGFMQHDAQELLVFLLDTLHEDLNLVKKKPYFAEGGPSDRPVTYLAADAWAKHLKREHSMVGRLFQGQLHNSVACPSCRYTSHTFSPFLFLPLALPVRRERSLFITVVRQLRGKSGALLVSRTRYAVSVLPQLQWRAVLDSLSALCGVPADRLWPVDVRGHVIHSEFDLDDAVRDAGPHVVAMELCAPGALSDRSQGEGDQTQDEQGDEVDGDWLEVVVLHRLKGGEDDAADAPIGTPLLARFPGSASFLDLRAGLAKLVAGLSSPRGDSPSGLCQLTKEEWESHGARLDVHSTDALGAPLPGMDTLLPSDPGTRVMDEPNRLTSDRMLFVSVMWDAVDDVFYEETRGERQGGHVYGETALFKTKDHVSAKRAVEKMRQKRLKGGNGFSLGECLDYFSNVEQLGSGNSWACPKCESQQRAYKKMNIIGLPEVLVLSLKRFESRGGGMAGLLGRGGKITSHVDFPLTGLDMAPYLAEFGGDLEKEDTVFDLFAVTNHHGSLGFGHYTAFAARQTGPAGPVEWFEYDDSRVSRVSPDTVVSTAAYVLYYRRRRGAASGGGVGAHL